jgi:hypothetical protein
MPIRFIDALLNLDPPHSTGQAAEQESIRSKGGKRIAGNPFRAY